MAEIISKINTERIQWCCNEFSIDIKKLSVEKKIPVKKLISGELTYRQLERISNFFGYTPPFYLESELPTDEEVHTAEFRSIANQSVKLDLKTARIIKQTEWHRYLYLGLMEDLTEEQFFESPILDGSILKKATDTREWLGIDDSKKYHYKDYRELIEAKGILVFQSMFYAGAWEMKESDAIGFSIFYPKVPVIFIKETSPQRQTFTLFHELGHILLHHTSSIDGKIQFDENNPDINEQQANEFATHCLLPDSLLDNITIPIDVKNYHSAFSMLAEHCGISVEVIVVACMKKYKINRDKYLDYKKYKELNSMEVINRENLNIPRKNRHKEPLHIFGNNYVGTVLTACNSGIITLSKTSNYLDNLKVRDIKMLQEFLWNPS